MLDYKSIGRRIRHYRQHCGYTQEELGLSINTSAAYISNIERGVKKPSLENLADIAAALDITINDMVAPQRNSMNHKNASDSLPQQYSATTRSKIRASLDEIINILEQND